MDETLDTLLTPALMDVMAGIIGSSITLAAAPDGKILYAAGALTSPNAGASVGIDLKAYVRHFQVYTQGGEPARTEDLPMVRVLATGEPVLNEAWVLGDDEGARTPIICDCWPLKSKDGVVLGAIVISTDCRNWNERAAPMKVGALIGALSGR